MLSWFLLGLAFGPVALVAVGFAGRAVGTRFRECTECLEAVPRFAMTCPNCGNDLLAVDEAAESDGLGS